MSSINDKLGLRRAGPRAMMKLPKTLGARNRLTSARCPLCQRTGAHLSRLKSEVGWFVCGWCGHAWDPAGV